MKKINLNDSMIIYPNQDGWDKILLDLVRMEKAKNLKMHEILDSMNEHKTNDKGYSLSISDMIVLHPNIIRYKDKYLKTTEVKIVKV